MASFLRSQLPAFAWATLIFARSAMPMGFYARFGISESWVPKAIHVLFYPVFCLLLSRAFRFQRHSTFLARWNIPLSILVCMTFGILDEAHQMFVAGRHPRMTDVLFDLSGAILMALAMRLWDQYQSVRRERVTP